MDFGYVIILVTWVPHLWTLLMLLSE